MKRIPVLIRKETSKECFSILDKLKVYGYKEGYSTRLRIINHVLTNSNHVYLASEDDTKEEILFNKNVDIVDCGINEDLFYALAAWNDENDYMQWFVAENIKNGKWEPLPDHWVLCDKKTIHEFALSNNSPNSYGVFRKAGKEDLINKFSIITGEGLYNDAVNKTLK